MWNVVHSASGFNDKKSKADDVEVLKNTTSKTDYFFLSGTGIHIHWLPTLFIAYSTGSFWIEEM